VVEGDDIPPITGAWLHASLPIEADWYMLDTQESDELFDWKMAMKATLTGGGAGTREVCIFFDRYTNGTTDKQICNTGTGTLVTKLSGLDTFDPGLSDDGRIYIRVSGDPSCAPYEIKLYFE